MLEFLYKLFVGNFDVCKHEYEVFHQENLVLKDNYGAVRKNFVKYHLKYHLKCKKCGELSFRNSA